MQPTQVALGNRSVYDIENHQTEYYYSTNTGSTPDAKYYYDGDGKRVKKVVGTETTIFIYNAGGNLAAEYTLGVTVNPSPQTNYLTTDTLGSTRVVTNGVGQVVARHDYLPFGDEIYGLGGRTSAQGFAQLDTTRQRFTGYEHDTETGLDFAQARYYGNGLGRFTSVDPILESAKTPDPQTWNRFIYVVNNPLKYVDPSGLDGTPWDSITEEDRQLIGSRLFPSQEQIKAAGSMESARKELFNTMVYQQAGTDPTLVAEVITGVINFIDGTGGRRNSEVWRSIQSIEYFWLGDNASVGVQFLVYDQTKFLETLRNSGYSVNSPLEKFNVFGDHGNSARLFTDTSYEPGFHIVQQTGYASNLFDAHWDPRSSAFKNWDAENYPTVSLEPLFPGWILPGSLREAADAGLSHGNPKSASSTRQAIRNMGMIPANLP